MSNCTDPEFLTYIHYHIDQVDHYLVNSSSVIGQPPVYKDGMSNFCSTPVISVTFPTAPRTEVTPRGDIVYLEVVRKLEA